MESEMNTDIWSGGFGDMYTERNDCNTTEIEELYMQNFGISRSELNSMFLQNMNRDIRILEVGSNLGIQLRLLQEMGFSNLFGIEINKDALEKCLQRNRHIYTIYGSALDIPFRDGFFDLVFTSGVLIHVNPFDLTQVLKEIHRCSNRYIWGYEYFADECTEILYRGRAHMLWRNDFRRCYQNLFDLTVIKDRKMSYLQRGLESQTDTMFLLEKCEK